MPALIANIDNIQHNIEYLVNLCKQKNLELVGVIKSIGLNPALIDLFQKANIEFLGIDSVQIAKKLHKTSNANFLLVAMPSPHNAHDVVLHCKSSLNSEFETIKALHVAAKKTKIMHEVILMVEIGDLREGILPEDLVKMINDILALDSAYIKISGIGANLACCSGVLPSLQNLTLLNTLALNVENECNIKIDKVSVGGSVMLDWIENSSLPSKINQLRSGEAIVLGTIPGINKPHPNLKADTFIFTGKVLEIKNKPSMPSGALGTNAFGIEPAFKNKGIRKRMILDFGAIHTIAQHLIPTHDNVVLIASNSNYTIYDITDCHHKFNIGDDINFKVTYASMVQSLMSPYVECRVA